MDPILHRKGFASQAPRTVRYCGAATIAASARANMRRRQLSDDSEPGGLGEYLRGGVQVRKASGEGGRRQAFGQRLVELEPASAR
jgi:hypothetical protein